MQIPRPAPGRAPIWLLATVGLLVLTAGAIWWGLAATVGKPTWIDVAWDVRDEHTVIVRYQVAKPADMTVRCLIEAQSEDHALVGSAEVEIGPLPEREMLHTTTLTTTGKAVRGGVRNCRAVS